MYVNDMGINIEGINARCAAGLVTARKKTRGGAELTIYNYTPRAQYSGAWDEVTRQCRGLILDNDRYVVARAVPKFFNYGQPGADTLDLDEPAVVMDKVDGSLGVIFPHDGYYHVATRGSFDSPQASEATAMLDALGYYPPDDLTVLVEIIYPDNRIVLDYGDRRALVLLGAVEIATGASVFPSDPRLASWPGERVEVMPATTLREALAIPPRPNAEGLVVMSADGLRRVKIKQADYVRLHKVLCGLSNLAIWEALRAGGAVLDGLYQVAPDELHPWMNQVVADLTRAHARLVGQWSEDYYAILAPLPLGFERKDFAIAARGHQQPSAMFAFLDGRTEAVDDLAWKLLRPEGRQSPTQAAADV